MDFIGTRISIKHSQEQTSIAILSYKEKTKSLILLLWLFLWSLSGLVVFFQYFTTDIPDIKAVIIVWLGFWLYFEYKILKAYLWRTQGKEIIRIRGKVFVYKKDLGGRGKEKEYFFDEIKNLRLVEVQENSFMETINSSYWVIAGERIAFDYYGAEVRLGHQLSDDDARKLLKLLKTKAKL